MKITTDWKLNLDTQSTLVKVTKATIGGLTDVVVMIANDAIKDSPFLTGNNRRSIQYEVGPGKEIAQKEGEAAVYSTSGYGGILETGSAKMPARPYMKPALDRNIVKLAKQIKEHMP